MNKSSLGRAGQNPSLFSRILSIGNLPYHTVMIPVVTILLLFFITLAAVVVAGGETVSPSDLRVVELSVDGVTRTVPTRAKTVGEFIESQQAVRLGEHDVVIPPLEAPILLGETFKIEVTRGRPVEIVEGDNTKIVVTASDSHRETVEKAGFKLEDEDEVEVLANPPTTEALQGGLVPTRLIIHRAALVSVSVYGNPIEVRTHAVTVGDLLAELSIAPKEDDAVIPEASTEVTSGMQVVILRTSGGEIQVEEETIPAGHQTVDDPTLPIGTSRLRDEGRPGERLAVYEIVNGRRILLHQVIKRQPRPRTTVRGTMVAASNPSANAQLGRQMAADRGWTGREWICLSQLWQKESGWNHLAHNRSSGAHGIPQALPGSKMGPGWQSDPLVQIRWGLGYIAGRYGTPCSAWEHSRRVGWY